MNASPANRTQRPFMRKFLIILMWMLMSVCVLLLVTLPVNPQTQLTAGATVLFLMMVLKTLNAGGIWRLISLAFGTAIVMRYVYWRLTSAHASRRNAPIS